MHRILPLLLSLLVSVFAGCSDRGPDAPPSTNLFLLTIDTLRADHLGCYGYPRPTSPAMDRLAGEGVRFETPIVQRGGTWPSLTSILTSLHPRSHGVRQNGEQLDASKRILAQELQGHGYATAAFLTNMINAPNRGFDHKEGFREGGDTAATTAAIAWLREHAGERFFVWLHLLGPHDPYVPSAEYRERFPSGYHGRLDGSRKKLERIWKRKRDLTEAELAHVVSLYDGDVAETDDQVDRALRALSELGLDGSTLVVLTSDHGEELYEHNHYFFHSYSIYESVLHVPLMLRLPGALPAGLVVDRPVESVDIAPTILEVLGLPVPDAYEGESLLPRIGAADQGGASSNEAAAFSELGPEIFSIQTARWHYIYNPRGHTSPNPEHLGRRDIRPYFNIEREELYDVVADPGETVNLAASRSDVAKALRERLVRWIEESDSDYRPGALLPEVEDELRALGYLD